MLVAMTPATVHKQLPKRDAADGRTARAARTNEAVVDALLALIEEGDLRPAAQRIADRAGVSLRSVFHHFNDIETLYATVAERQLRRYFKPAAATAAPTGSIQKRIEVFVDARSALLEAITPVRRAAVLNEPFSPALASRLKWARSIASDEVARTFDAELAALKPTARRDVLAALAVATEWSAWEALRAHQGLSPARARGVMKRTISALLCSG